MRKSHIPQLSQLAHLSPSLTNFLMIGAVNQQMTCGCLQPGCHCHELLPAGQSGVCCNCARGRHYTGDYARLINHAFTANFPSMNAAYCACRVRTCVCVTPVSNEGEVCGKCQTGDHKHGGGLNILQARPMAQVMFCNCNAPGCRCSATLPSGESGMCFQCRNNRHLYEESCIRLGQDDFDDCACSYPGCMCTKPVPITNPGPCSSCLMGGHDLGSYHQPFSPMAYQPFQVVSITRFTPMNGKFHCACSMGCGCTSEFDQAGKICSTCRRYCYGQG